MFNRQLCDLTATTIDLWIVCLHLSGKRRLLRASNIPREWAESSRAADVRAALTSLVARQPVHVRLERCYVTVLRLYMYYKHSLLLASTLNFFCRRVARPSDTKAAHRHRARVGLPPPTASRPPQTEFRKQPSEFTAISRFPLSCRFFFQYLVKFFAVSLQRLVFVNVCNVYVP